MMLTDDWLAREQQPLVFSKATTYGLFPRTHCISGTFKFLPKQPLELGRLELAFMCFIFANHYLRPLLRGSFNIYFWRCNVSRPFLHKAIRPMLMAEYHGFLPVPVCVCKKPWQHIQLQKREINGKTALSEGRPNRRPKVAFEQ